MEFFIYLLIYFFAVFFSLTNYKLKKERFFVLWFLISMFLSFYVRTGYDLTVESDFLQYSRVMQMEDIPMFFYREFIFIYTVQILYKITSDPVIVFIILDCVFYIFLYRGISYLRKGLFPKVSNVSMYYIYFSVLLFFPIVLGFHNTYRQLFSTALAIFAYGLYINNFKRNGLLYFIISFFIHNSSIFFLPIFLLANKNKFSKLLSLLTLITIVFVNTTIAESTNEILVRDFTSTKEGANITLMYICSLLFIFFFIWLTEIYFSSIRKIYFTWIVLFMCIIYFSSIIGFSSGVSQRVAFLIFSFVYLLVGLYFEAIFKQKKFIRFVFINLSLLPLIFIHNATIPTPF
ncbi:MAG: hypothetical protein CMJ05_02740 [Pelagibacterales bacterium]|nr:hypothetical protein [Pelagibacterales bacterium]